MKKSLLILLLVGLLLSLGACDQTSNGSDRPITITINVDNQSVLAEINSGETVQTALDNAGITLSNADQVEPATYSVLTEETAIEVIRVTEEFLYREEPIPFSSQTVKNETLPEGQTLLIQKGQNGTLEIATKITYHNNVEQSRTEFSRTIKQAAKPEIVMVGIQSPFSPIAINGQIAYITTGNIWVMEKNTGNRRPVVTTGDADGQVLKISPDGEWLLFTKTLDEEENGTNDLNALYAVSLTDPNSDPFSLNARNVIHFADWVPNRSRTVTYSTVEPRETADWLANNDLYLVTFNNNGTVLTNDSILDPTKDGVNFWWGTDFSWSPDGSRLAYAKPDSIGLVDIEDNELIELFAFTSYEPDLDWRWLPSLGWAYDHGVLYTVNHQLNQNGSGSLFSLTAVLPSDALSIDIVPDVGMFSFPVPSPIDEEERYQIAYLQAVFPERSDTSRYNLMLMDRDGSNRELLFPPEGSLGLSPQEVQWEPLTETTENRYLAFNYQGNIYIYDLNEKETIQITGDGSITNLHWQ
jgi:hypothetical protein